MNKLYVSTLAEKKIRRGVQLLDSKDFQNLGEINQLVALYGQSGNFLGTEYLSVQNKGIGWLLSKDKIQLTKSYFVSLFEEARKKRSTYESSDLTTAYRLFNQDGDNFGGLTIDLYNDFALISWYNSFVYDLRLLIVEAFQEVFPNVY